jgi:hypothetical protein
MASTFVEEVEMLLIETADGAVDAVRPRLRDRLLARLNAERIDRDLAAGAPPDANVAFALRARTLTSMRTRQMLAGGLQRALSATARTRRAPIDRLGVLGASADIAELSRRLLADGPVAPRGAAQAHLLLAAGAGPLHNRRSPERLASSVRLAICALDL